MSNAAAWVLNINESLHVSVSQLELVHIINEPYYIKVPGAPDYCNKIIIWNDNILPVVNIANLAGNHGSASRYNVVAVIIYRDHDEQVHYGGISLISSPELEYVNNSHVCTLPDLSYLLQETSLSCFTCKKGRKIPIIDSSRLFSREYTQNIIREHARNQMINNET